MDLQLKPVDLQLRPDRTYNAVWQPAELGGRGKILLIISSVRLVIPNGRQRAEIELFASSNYVRRNILSSLPDGLYEYYPADTVTQEQLQAKKYVFFGKKRQITVSRVQENGEFDRVKLFSTLPLQAGDCILRYTSGICIPLPETKEEPGGYVVDFLLRRRIECTLCVADDLNDMFELKYV